MQRTRDWRRAQRARIIKRVIQLERNRNWHTPEPLSDWYNWIDDNGRRRSLRTWIDIFELREQRARRLAGNRCTCSGYCCGNPRKWLGELTRQEKRLSCEID